MTLNMNYKIGCWKLLNFIKPLLITCNKYYIDVVLLCMYLYNLLKNQILMNFIYSLKSFSNQQQYNLPTISQVATIIIIGDT